MRVKTLGTIVMLLASLLFIAAAPWYLALDFRGTNWGIPLLQGLLWGVPALIGTLLAWRKPGFGAPLSIGLFFFPGLLFLFETFGGDSGIRQPSSLLLISLTYLAGASVVLIGHDTARTRLN